MSYCEERMWAILWIPDGDGEPWLFTDTVSRTRRGAIQKALQHEDSRRTWRHLTTGATPRGLYQLPGKAKAVIVNVDVEPGWYEEAVRRAR